MSKTVTFTDIPRTFRISKNVLITDMTLNITDHTYQNITFDDNDIKIIVYSGEVRKDLEEDKHIEIISRVIEKIRPCRMRWNGYAKYNNYKGMTCDKKCAESSCTKYTNYAEYIRNKQMRVIPEFIKLVVED
tara:strand:+ start:168 stop:563 length:396 start_codon:yes stop_codon:yes gene_type:complete